MPYTRKLITGLLAHWGYRIIKNDPNYLPPKDMRSAIEFVAKYFQIHTIVDVGASSGIWSNMVMEFFQDSQFLLIEAQPVHSDALEAFVASHKNSQFVLAAAGSKQGQLCFDASDPYGGQASYTPYENSNLVVPVTTIDDEVKAKDLRGPYLLKLDTHGFEVPIFEGASKTLTDTNVIVVECYNFKISPECLLFNEMCDYLGKIGFRCIDLVDPLWRPYDHSFWQMDLVFVRKDSALFSYANYE